MQVSQTFKIYHFSFQFSTDVFAIPAGLENCRKKNYYLSAVLQLQRFEKQPCVLKICIVTFFG